MLLLLFLELNSSTIDELGSWCVKGWWNQATILAQGRKYPSQPCKQPPHRHHHTDPVSGILSDTQYLPMGGRRGTGKLHKYRQAIVNDLKGQQASKLNA